MYFRNSDPQKNLIKQLLKRVIQYIIYMELFTLYCLGP